MSHILYLTNVRTLHVFFIIFFLNLSIEIINGCEVRIENSVTRVTVRHREVTETRNRLKLCFCFLISKVFDPKCFVILYLYLVFVKTTTMPFKLKQKIAFTKYLQR